MQIFLVCQSEDRTGPVVEHVEPEVRAQPSQPQEEPRAVSPGSKLASERFKKTF